MKAEDIERTKKIAEMAAEGKPLPKADDGRPPSQATLLVQLAADTDLFHTPDGEAYATVLVNGHKETRMLKEKAFRHYLMQLFYEQENKSPHAQALQSAIGTLTGKALFKARELPVFIRLAQYKGKVYIDLANDKWEAIEVDEAGWRIVIDPPIKFRRTKGMLPLPYPVEGGSINELQPFINHGSENDFILIVSFIVAALSPSGPYTILALHGEHGSAKSTAAKVIRSLIDPNKSPLRSETKDSRDLMIAANNGWCLVFDNLSYIKNKLSDDLCRLATGGGFTTRELYTDTDEALFDAQRPVIINGIEELATRSDLLDRLLILYLPRITDDKRKPERLFWREFETARPRILGALCDAVSTALRNLESISLAAIPRMADFTYWVSAAESAFGWQPDTFLAAYKANRNELHELALEASVIAPTVRALIENHGVWEGTATDLLSELNRFADDNTRKQRGWPKNARSVSGYLRRITPNLRTVGIEVDFWRQDDTGRTRMITITRRGDSSVPSVQSVQSLSPGTVTDATDDQKPTQTNEVQRPLYSTFPLYGKPHDHKYALVSDARGAYERCTLCGEFAPKGNT